MNEREIEGLRAKITAGLMVMNSSNYKDSDKVGTAKHLFAYIHTVLFDCSPEGYTKVGKPFIGESNER